MQQGFFVNVTAGRAVYKNAERPEASGWGVATLLREILAMDVKAGGGKGRDLTRRMFYIPALIVAAVLLACVATLLALSEKAEATFPGENGRIAYMDSFSLYTINVGGGAKTKVTNNNRGDEDSSYSPNGKRIAYAGWDGHDLEIYTIGVNGKNRVRLTNNATNDGFPDYSPNGKKIAAWSEKGQYIYTISVHGG